MIRGAIEVIVDAKGAGEGECGDCIIIKVNITRDGFGGDSEARMGPSSVCESREAGRKKNSLTVHDCNLHSLYDFGFRVNDRCQHQLVPLALPNYDESQGGGH